MKATILRYHVVIRKDGKHYIADVPTLGISDFGRTLELAKHHIHDAIACHIEGLMKTGYDVPMPDTEDYYVGFTTVRVPFAVPV